MTDPPSSNPIEYREIERIVKQAVDQIAPPKTSQFDPVALRAEYQTVVEIIKLLSDIRFRCIVFVTALITAAVTFSGFATTPGDVGMRAAIGVLGFFATLGITIYELRNSQLYEMAIHRAGVLETRLKMEGSTQLGGIAGLFSERPPYVSKTVWSKSSPTERRKSNKLKLMRFWCVQVKHDRGLALVYGAVLGAWVYLAVFGLLSLPAPVQPWGGQSIGSLRLVSALIGIVVFGFSFWRLKVHDNKRLREPRPAGDAPIAAAKAKPSFDLEAMTVTLIDGREIRVPLEWYPELSKVTPVKRSNVVLQENGQKLHWEELNFSAWVEDVIKAR
jgi:hypothetical protein